MKISGEKSTWENIFFPSLHLQKESLVMNKQSKKYMLWNCTFRRMSKVFSNIFLMKEKKLIFMFFSGKNFQITFLIFFSRKQSHHHESCFLLNFEWFQMRYHANKRLVWKKIFTCHWFWGSFVIENCVLRWWHSMAFDKIMLWVREVKWKNDVENEKPQTATLTKVLINCRRLVNRVLNNDCLKLTQINLFLEFACGLHYFFFWRGTSTSTA